MLSAPWRVLYRTVYVCHALTGADAVHMSSRAATVESVSFRRARCRCGGQQLQLQLQMQPCLNPFFAFIFMPLTGITSYNVWYNS